MSTHRIPNTREMKSEISTFKRRISRHWYVAAVLPSLLALTAVLLFVITSGPAGADSVVRNAPLLTPTASSTPTAGCCTDLTGTAGSLCLWENNLWFGSTITNNCGQAILGNVTNTLEIAPYPVGPWLELDVMPHPNVYFAPGNNDYSGSHTSGFPPGYGWYRIHMVANSADGCWQTEAVTTPVPLCLEATPVATDTPTPTATIASPTSTVEPEWAILQYVKDTHPQWTCGPIYGTPGHRTLGCYTGAGHTGSGSVDNYGDPGAASANWQQRRDHAQTFYPIFNDDAWNGYPGYHGEGNVPPYGFFTREYFYWGDVRVLGGVSVDDTAYHYAPDIAFAIMSAASVLGYLPPPSPTPTPLSPTPTPLSPTTTPFSPTVTASPTHPGPTPPPPTPSRPDLIGSATWLASCNTPGILLRTQWNGPSFSFTPGPSTMRLENSAGDYRDFQVPPLGYPSPGYYDYACSIGPCIPESWQSSLPYTLTVDIFNAVAENNETNNRSTIGGSVPTPVPCGLTPTPVPTSCTLTFVDVPLDHPFYGFVRCLACRGFVSGYADGSFRPMNNATRGQVAKIVAQAARIDDDPGAQIYEDVAPGSTFYTWTNSLSRRDGGHGYIIGGYPCGSPGEPCVQPDNRRYFRPNANATRAQVAKIVSNAAGFSDSPCCQKFADVAPDNTFYAVVQRLASRGIINGYPCGSPGEPCSLPDNLPYFRPNGNVTRGQTAKILSNTFFPNCSTPSGPCAMGGL